MDRHEPLESDPDLTDNNGPSRLTGQPTITPPTGWNGGGREARHSPSLKPTWPKAKAEAQHNRKLPDQASAPEPRTGQDSKNFHPPPPGKPGLSVEKKNDLQSSPTTSPPARPTGLTGTITHSAVSLI